MAYRRLGLTGTGEDDVQSAAERVEERHAPTYKGRRRSLTDEVLRPTPALSQIREALGEACS